MKRRRKDGTLQFFVWVIVITGMWATFTIVGNPSYEGKPPDHEETYFKEERDLRTGELFKVEVIQCKLCGQIVSYTRFNLQGKAVSKSNRSTHDCNRPLAKWQGANPLVNILDFLTFWQARLVRALK